jgi:hypothetical protein
MSRSAAAGAVSRASIATTSPSARRIRRKAPPPIPAENGCATPSAKAAATAASTAFPPASSIVTPARVASAWEVTTIPARAMAGADAAARADGAASAGSSSKATTAAAAEAVAAKERKDAKDENPGERASALLIPRTLSQRRPALDALLTPIGRLPNIGASE